jgi:hypothetical protein
MNWSNIKSSVVRWINAPTTPRFYRWTIAAEVVGLLLAVFNWSYGDSVFWTLFWVGFICWDIYSLWQLGGLPGWMNKAISWVNRLFGKV